MKARMAVRSARIIFSVGTALALLGCGVLKKKTEAVDAAATEPADNATVAVDGTGAKNAKDVLRYAKEEKIADEAATIGKEGTKPRTFPGNGVEIATLMKGTPVVKIAKYFSTGVLIVFDDPTAAGTKLLGWVGPESLLQVGAGPTTTATWSPPKDAGTIAIKDAGGAADAGRVVDAGGGAPAVGRATLLVPVPPDGKCPGGFAVISGMCRRTCGSEADCPRGTFCVAGGGKKYCSTSK